LENPQKWSGISKASISIGYGIGTTAIQMAAAYAAAINGGYLYRPYIVDHLQNADGEIQQAAKPLMVRQIISKEVSAKLKEFMYAAVEYGTGKEARVKGVKVGGKTGTAHMVEKGRYVNRYNTSFLGFVDDKNHSYTMGVVVIEPKLIFAFAETWQRYYVEFGWSIAVSGLP